jgi:hypothetical protein
LKTGSFKYPQNLWAEAIVGLFTSGTLKVSEHTIVFDGPCGNGLVGYMVKQRLPNLNMCLLDNDKALLQSPYGVSKEGYQVQLGDIYDAALEGTDNIWLFVNSLFCLTGVEQLVQTRKKEFASIVAIVPNIRSSNYRYFVKQNPSFVNPSAMDLEQTNAFFKNQGYILESSTGITRVPFHKYNNSALWQRLPLRFRNSFLTFIDKFGIFNSYHYTMMVYRRVQE